MHTPGPWRVGDAGQTVFGPPNGNPSPQTIAHMARGADWRDNARLIAAAPELLAELNACHAFLSLAILPGYAYDNPMRDSIRVRLAEIRAAIAKAGG